MHLVVLVGCSAGAYSLALAGMTALQSRADAALAGDRTPMVQTLDAIAANHDELERAVSAAASEYDRLAGTYERSRRDVQRRRGSPRCARRDGVLDLTYGLVAAFAGDSAVGPICDTERDTAPYACHDRRLGLTEQASADGVAFAATSMGSPLRLTVAGSAQDCPPNGPTRSTPLVEPGTRTRAEFAAVDEAMSRFSETSGLTALNRSAGTGRLMAVDRRLERALLAAERARRITDGHFDPRVVDDLEFAW